MCKPFWGKICRVFTKQLSKLGSVFSFFVLFSTYTKLSVLPQKRFIVFFCIIGLEFWTFFLSALFWRIFCWGFTLGFTKERVICIIFPIKLLHNHLAYENLLFDRFRTQFYLLCFSFDEFFAELSPWVSWFHENVIYSCFFLNFLYQITTNVII